MHDIFQLTENQVNMFCLCHLLDTLLTFVSIQYSFDGNYHDTKVSAGSDIIYCEFDRQITKNLIESF